MFVRQNLVYGKLDAELGAVATTISSSALAGLVVVAAPDRVRVVLDPQGQFGVPELVDVTAHAVDATSATVVRAVEDSGRLPARVHPVGTRWAVVDTVESLPVAAIDSGVVAGGARIAVAPPDWLEETPGSVSITSQALVDDPNPSPQPDELTGDEVPGDGGTQVGPAAWAEGWYAVALGTPSHAEGELSIALGFLSHAEGDESVAFGTYSSAKGDESLAIRDSAAEASRSTAIASSTAEGYGSAAIQYSHAGGYQSLAIQDSFVLGDYSVAIQGGAALEDDSIAIGRDSIAYYESSVALGSYSETTAVDQVHIGDRHLMSDAGRAVVSEEANVIKVVDETGWGAIVSPDADTIYFVVEDTP